MAASTEEGSDTSTNTGIQRRKAGTGSPLLTPLGATPRPHLPQQYFLLADAKNCGGKENYLVEETMTRKKVVLASEDTASGLVAFIQHCYCNVSSRS